MTTKRIILAGFLLLATGSFCQAQPLNCKGIRQGTFYYYPKNTSEQYSVRMDGSFEYQTDLRSGDSTICRIKWLKDCTYSEDYVGGNTKIPPQILKILKKRTFYYQVTGITKGYFTFLCYLYKSLQLPLRRDTFWFSPRAHPGNRPLFKVVPAISQLKRRHFTDTSRYAIVYFYRPGKATNFLNFYPLFLDNVEMAIIQNNSAYIFKILHEGPLKITGTLFGHSTYLTLPVQFGHSYYVKSKVHFGGTRYSTHAEMEVVDEKTGRNGFSHVRVRSVD
jgi:hypothetical protein